MITFPPESFVPVYCALVTIKALATASKVIEAAACLRIFAIENARNALRWSLGGFVILVLLSAGETRISGHELAVLFLTGSLHSGHAVATTVAFLIFHHRLGRFAGMSWSSSVSSLTELGPLALFAFAVGMIETPANVDGILHAVRMLTLPVLTTVAFLPFGRELRDGFFKIATLFDGAKPRRRTQDPEAHSLPSSNPSVPAGPSVVVVIVGNPNLNPERTFDILPVESISTPQTTPPAPAALPPAITKALPEFIKSALPVKTPRREHH